MKTDRTWWSKAVLKARMAPQQDMADALGAAATMEYLAMRLGGRIGQVIVNQFGAADRLALGRPIMKAAPVGDKSISPFAGEHRPRLIFPGTQRKNK